jgi:hypothetical protein
MRKLEPSRYALGMMAGVARSLALFSVSLVAGFALVGCAARLAVQPTSSDAVSASTATPREKSRSDAVRDAARDAARAPDIAAAARALARGTPGDEARDDDANAAPSYGSPPPTVKPGAQPLTFAAITKLLETRGRNLRMPRPGVWHVLVDGVVVMTVAEGARLSVVAPIFSMQQLDADPSAQHAVMRRLLQANFDPSADVRYALFDGIIFATVTSARDLVREGDLDRFLTQVVNLHKNTFRNGKRGYSPEEPEPDAEEVDPRQDDTLERPRTPEARKPARTAPRGDLTEL